MQLLIAHTKVHEQELKETFLAKELSNVFSFSYSWLELFCMNTFEDILFLQQIFWDDLQAYLKKGTYRQHTREWQLFQAHRR